MSGFAEALEAEMVRVLTRGYHPALSRAEVERIGQATGLTPKRAVEECVRLRGRVWGGGIIDTKDKGIMAFSPDRAWFHERGKLPDLGYVSQTSTRMPLTTYTEFDDPPYTLPLRGS